MSSRCVYWIIPGPRPISVVKFTVTPELLQGLVNETIGRYQPQRKSNGSVTNRKSSTLIVQGIFILRTPGTHGRTDPI